MTPADAPSNTELRTLASKIVTRTTHRVCPEHYSTLLLHYSALQRFILKFMKPIGQFSNFMPSNFSTRHACRDLCRYMFRQKRLRKFLSKWTLHTMGYPGRVLNSRDPVHPAWPPPIGVPLCLQGTNTERRYSSNRTQETVVFLVKIAPTLPP